MTWIPTIPDDLEVKFSPGGFWDYTFFAPDIREFLECLNELLEEHMANKSRPRGDGHMRSIVREWHPTSWSIIAGAYLTVWSFGIYLEAGPQEIELRLGLGPLDLYVGKRR